MKVRVTLEIEYFEGGVSSPDAWDWQALLDLGPDESVKVTEFATLEPAGKSDLMLAAEAVAAIEFFVDDTYCLTTEAFEALNSLRAAVKKARGE